MCGLAGFISHKNIGAEALMKKMLSKIKHRGPDDCGVFFDQDIGLCLGHQRLSIQDLSSSGHQPMVSDDKRYVLTFNGEIYNFLDLKKQLNYPFQGNSDTEVLLAALQIWGLKETLTKIVGMFAFALWDNKTKCLTLARDRIAEKPLYYGWQQGSFLFASELVAMREHPDFIGDIDRNALASFLRYNYVPAPYSIYQGIKKLMPGHYLTYHYQQNNWQEKSHCYWSVFDRQKTLSTTLVNDEGLAKKMIKTQLKQTISEQMNADVATGAFLSGGIDSSLICALMQNNTSQAIDTFSIGFASKQYNEAHHAKKIAKHLGTNHHEFYVTPDDCLAVVENLPTIYSEPFADASQVPTYLLAKLAKQHISVSLSGDGGDELFGGYSRYQNLPRIWRGLKHLSNQQRQLLKKALTKISVSNWNRLSFLSRQANFGDKVYKLANVLESDSYGQLFKNITSLSLNPNSLVKQGSEYSQDYAIDDVLAMMLFDQSHYLADDILTKVDRATMAVSLESRAPFLDHRLIEMTYKIPLSLHFKNGQSKYLLRQILKDYMPVEWFARPKMGFSMPIEYWLRNELKDWAASLLTKTQLQDYFQPEAIETLWQQHLSGKYNWQYQLWGVLMFQAWRQAHS